MSTASDLEVRLEAVLREAQRIHLIGKAPISRQESHSDTFLAALDDEPLDGPLVDLGAGGGVPGLVIAARHPDLEIVLLDAGLRATAFLSWAVEEMGCADRVTVVRARAEEFGTETRWRAAFSCCVARSFGPPAVTAECAAPLLRVGGRLAVSEPPADQPVDGPRWPAEHLAELGLEIHREVTAPFHVVVLRQQRRCSDRYPRRVGVPGKRPLF